MSNTSNLNRASASQPAIQSVNTIESLAGAILFSRAVLQEIRRIWPAQTRQWPNDAELERSWARCILQSGVEVGQLRSALARLSIKAYPCDAGALVEDALLGGISLQQAKVSLSKVCLAAGSGNYSALSTAEYAAAKQFGIYELRQLSTSLEHVKHWRLLLAPFIHRTDLPYPPTPKPKLPVPPKGLSDIGHAHLRTLKQTLNPRYSNQTSADHGCKNDEYT